MNKDHFTLNFQVEYDTKGNKLGIIGSIKELGEWSEGKEVMMTWGKGNIWKSKVEIPIPQNFELDFKYVEMDLGGKIIRSEDHPHNLSIDQTFRNHNILMINRWNSRNSLDVINNTSALEVVRNRTKKDIQPKSLLHPPSDDQMQMLMRLTHYNLKKGESIYMTGSNNTLGEWKTERAIELKDYNFPILESHFSIPISPNSSPSFEYKFFKASTTSLQQHEEEKKFDQEKVRWERGKNREMKIVQKGENDADEIEDENKAENGRTDKMDNKVEKKGNEKYTCMVIEEERFKGGMEREGGGRDGEEEEKWRGVGVAVPLFSLRSTESVGVGEYEDIKLLVDIAVKSKIKLIQLLPLNDTTAVGNWKDSSPYNAISVFALHPLYIRLQSIEGVKNDPSILSLILQHQLLYNSPPSTECDQKERSDQREKAEINGFLDYDKTFQFKMKVLRLIFKSQQLSFLQNPQYKEWFEENKEWLIPYAVYSSLRDLYGTTDYKTWPSYSTISEEQLSILSDPNSKTPLYLDSILFYYFVQFNCFSQLKFASLYCSLNGVALKGDLPIGVHPHSVDTWYTPHIFHLHHSAGVPPDMINDEGQNWGFPTYNWEVMEKDGFRWWRMRLKVFAYFFHAYRIDHVLGFFRIWQISRLNDIGYLGKFEPVVPLSKRAFEEKGIKDLKRLKTPFVTWDEMFSYSKGDESKCKYILTHYFDQTSFCSSYYFIKPQFEEIEELKKEMEKNEEEEETKGIMKKIMGNVVIMEHIEENEDDSEKKEEYYHFRVEMQRTTSFQKIEENEIKDSLNSLYFLYFGDLQDKLWRECALKRLPVMQNSTKMLVCGEDLGTVPKCVGGVLDELSILSLRIQRFPKETNERIENPLNNPYFSVSSPSVHDISTLRGWWKEDKESAKYLLEMLGIGGDISEECQPETIEKILDIHFASPSILVVIAIQDFFALEKELSVISAEDERINLPFVGQHYWRYRIPFTLEKLLCCDKWLNKISNLIEKNNRC